jgi:hypothetical protein
MYWLEGKAPILCFHIALSPNDHRNMCRLPGQAINRPVEPGMGQPLLLEIVDKERREQLSIGSPMIFGTGHTWNLQGLPEDLPRRGSSEPADVQQSRPQLGRCPVHEISVDERTGRTGQVEDIVAAYPGEKGLRRMALRQIDQQLVIGL